MFLRFALRCLVVLFRIVPFWCLYGLADVVYYIFYYVLRYRKRVVAENISRALPELSAAEQAEVVRKSYRNLADIIVESLKGFAASPETLKERYKVLNPEILNETEGSALVLTAHYGNWEWGCYSFPMWIDKKKVAILYKKIKNETINHFVNHSRSSTGAEMVVIEQTPRTFIRNKNTPTAYVMVSDQSSPDTNAHWLTFLHQESAFLHGADRYARLTGYPVFYAEIARVKRGFYEITLEKLITDPKNQPDEAITKIYAQRVEQTIRNQPENWLWTHKRWKRKREG